MLKVKQIIHHFTSDSLYRNALYLFATNAGLAATGFAFWAIAARLFPSAEIGLVSTIIAAATFIASASLFGLDHTLIHYLGKHKANTTAILDTALGIITVGALLFSAGYLLIVPEIAPELSFVLSSPLWILAFVGLMIVSTWNNILGSIFIAFRAAQFIFIAGILFGFGRIILLSLFHNQGTTSLFSAHFISFSCGVAAALIGIYVAKKYIYKPSFSKKVLQLIRGYSLRTYIASLLASLPPLLTPLLVMSILGPSEAAYYNMPILMIGLLTIIPMTTSQSLFAEGVHGENELKKLVIKSVKLIYMLVIPAVILVIGSGYFVLSIFGGEYAFHGYGLLVLLSLATLFKAASFPLTAILRIVGDIKEIIIATALYVFCLVCSTYIALSTTSQLWAIGIAALVSEILLLGIYAYIIKIKWPKLASLPKKSITTEI